MKLYLISQTAKTGYDTYDSAVVAAENETEAKQTHPSGGLLEDQDYYGSWAKSPDKVICEFLGEAKDGTEKGVICASFNVG